MAMRRIFWGFCINSFGIGPLHYVSSCSDFGFKFGEIFVIEKRLPNPTSQGINKIVYRYIVILHYTPGFFFAKLIF